MAVARLDFKMGGIGTKIVRNQGGEPFGKPVAGNGTRLHGVKF